MYDVLMEKGDHGHRCKEKEDEKTQREHRNGVMHLQAPEHKRLPKTHQWLKSDKEGFLYSFQRVNLFCVAKTERQRLSSL